MNNFEIIGQSALIDGLRSVMDSGRIVHSYIFTGPKGIGKRTISNYFAKMLLCDEENKPCNECQSCRQFDSSNHPDVIRIKSSNNTIGIEPIREMRSDIGIKPFQGRLKIYIIEQGETMNHHAQNALLKTLEEPPEHAIIIILAENLASLFPTIISRCQQIRVPQLSTQEMVKLIHERTQTPIDLAQVYAKLSEGIPGKGLELASSQEHQQMRQDTLDILDSLAKASLVDSMSYVDYFLDNRDNATKLLDMLELWLRDILVLKQSNNVDLIVNIDKLAHIQSLANSFTTRAIQCIIEEIENSKKMLMAHANFQLTIENLLMKVQGSDEYARGGRSTV